MLLGSGSWTYTGKLWFRSSRKIYAIVHVAYFLVLFCECKIIPFVSGLIILLEDWAG